MNLMSTATAPLTVEQFLELPEHETLRYELVHGEVVEMANAGSPHEIVKANANWVLHAYLLPNPIGRVFIETAFKLMPDEGRRPDVALVMSHRLHPDVENSFQGAPELAIEVVSSETAARLEEKINLYLETGARAVWAVFPGSRTVWVHRAGGVALHLQEGDMLEEPDLLPGFRVPVAHFFQGM